MIPLIQLFGALVAASCFKRIIFHLLDPLRVVPGPFLARFTRLWYLVETIRGRGHETICRLHQKHGMLLALSRTVDAIYVNLVLPSGLNNSN